MIPPGPHYVFSRKAHNAAGIERRLKNAGTVFLFLDYDGTLTPIRSIPSEAVLSSAAKTLLRSVTALPDVHVAIVTGRSMKSIRRFIPACTITLAANHGLHILHEDGTEWIHENARASLHVLDAVRRRLRSEVKAAPGAFIENKELTLSIHVRKCAPAAARLLARAIERITAAVAPELRITKGKKVIELRPPTPWGKSGAVLKLLHARGSHGAVAVYIGDDATDEEAFRAVRPDGIAIRVGRKKRTEADYYVNDAAEVHAFLHMLLRARSMDNPTSPDDKGR